MINEQMRKDLIALGIKSDDTVLMHSSLSSLGYIEGGAETVIDTLLAVLSEGTLLVPTLSWTTVNKDNPVFDVKDTTEFTLIDENGKKYVQSYRCHNFGVTKMAQRYERLADVMDIPHGKVLEAESWLIPSKEMWEKGKQKIIEKEEFFVEPY